MAGDWLADSNPDKRPKTRDGSEADGGYPWLCECFGVGRRSAQCERCLTCGAYAPWIRWPTWEDYIEEMADAASY
jgi:hypothetical protein